MAKKNEIVKSAEEYEAAFHGIEIPESFELATGVHVPNTREFIEKSIYILKTGGNRVATPVRWRLDKLLEIINRNNQHE